MKLKIRIWDTHTEKMIPGEDVIGLDGNLTESLPNDLIPMLSTGKNSKDRNEIFEGDIVKSGMTGGLYIIRFGDFTTKNSSGIGFWKEGINVDSRGWYEDSADIIKGNIYQHKHLLIEK